MRVAECVYSRLSSACVSIIVVVVVVVIVVVIIIIQAGMTRGMIARKRTYRSETLPSSPSRNHCVAATRAPIAIATAATTRDDDDDDDAAAVVARHPATATASGCSVKSRCHRRCYRYHCLRCRLHRCLHHYNHRHYHHCHHQHQHRHFHFRYRRPGSRTTRSPSAHSAAAGAPC